MKKLITSLLILFFIIGMGTKMYGQAAGDYVFTAGAADGKWATPGNWSYSDGAGGYQSPSPTVTPTYNDNVWIVSVSANPLITIVASNSQNTQITLGSTAATLTTASTSITKGMAVKGVGIAPGTYVFDVNGTSLTLSTPAIYTMAASSLNFIPACKNLYVNNGGVITVSAPLVAFGDITVNSTGTLIQSSDLYCANIMNLGVFKSSTGYGSSKNLYVGFNGAIPGTGSYIITNDGTFGDTQARASQVNGSGIRLYYSSQSNSFTVQPLSGSSNTPNFNIATITPFAGGAGGKSTANTNLNIKETMSLLLSSAICLSVQNNDSTINTTTRTCTIDHGVTVYIGGKFHANAGVPTLNQGNFVYNINGILDLASFTTGSSSNPNDFDLCMTNYTGNTGSLTFNLGDGSQANSGKLILGSNMKLIKQSNQTLAINLKDYSTVEYRNSINTSLVTYPVNYYLSNNNNPALYLFPKNFYNLTINGTGVILPVTPVTRGTFTYTVGGYGGTSNWTANATTTQGSIIYTASGNYYYTPFVRTTSTFASGIASIPLAGDTILNYIQPAQTVSASGITPGTTVSSIYTAGSSSLPISGTTSSAQANTLVAFVSKSGATAPTGTSSNTFSPVFDGTQGLIYLGNSEFNLTSNQTDYFRSNATGNESNVSSWQSSINHSVWHPATIVPGSSAASVVIQKGHLITVDANTTVSADTVNVGGQLTLNSGVTLNASSLTLLTSASGTGTFVDNNTSSGLTVNGATSVQQYLGSTATARNWYVSSPVSNATSNVFNPAGLINSLYWYDETGATSGTWTPVNDNATTLNAGKGYVVSLPLASDGIFTFTGGTLNDGAQSISLTNSPANSSYQGFNLVGNPYPSYLNWASVVSANSSLIGTTMWYRSYNTTSSAHVFDTYNSSGNQYVSNSGNTITGYIPPMQAFWVYASTGGSLSLTNSMCSHMDVAGNLLKAPASISTSSSALRLDVSNGVTSDETLIYTNDNALNGYDNYDSQKLSNDNDAIPEIASIVNGQKLVINGLNSIPVNTELPLSFTTGQQNTFTIKASQVSNFDAGTLIVLKDNLLGTETDLTSGGVYTFTSDVATSTNRFSVLFKSTSITTGLNKSIDNNVSVYRNDQNQITVNYTGDLSNKAVISVYNAVGVKLATKQITGNNTVITTSLASGVYLVTVNNAGVKTTKKVILD